MRYILLVIFLLEPVLSLQAGDSYYYFKQISIKEGLPSSVTAIYDDEGGFLWIGTIYGVYRFDGQKLKKCLFSDGRETSPLVNEILNDGKGHIWVFTNQGVSLYNHKEDVLEPFKADGKSVRAFTVLADEDQVILPAWGELLRYDKELKSYTKSTLLYQGRPIWVLKMEVYDAQHYLALTTERITLLIDRKTGETKESPFDTKHQVWCFYRDSAERYWISMYDVGVSCYSKQGELLDNYTPHNSGLNNAAILDIEERNGQIWLATDGGGINIIDPATRQITTLTSQKSNLFPANSVTCLTNGANNMWVGMVREGILGAKENFITSYSKATGNASIGLSEKCPLCLIEDTDGTIWIGTDGGGVNRFNPQTEQFTHYPSTAGGKIVSICALSEDELLISNYLTGLHLFNKKTGECRKFTIVNPIVDRDIRSSGTAINLYANKQGEIEIHGNSHYRYLKEKKQFVQLNVPKLKYTGAWIHIGGYEAKPYYYDRNDIFCYNYQTDEVEKVYQENTQHIIAAAIDKTGVLWVAGRDSLVTFNVDTHETTAVKLPDNNDLVTSIVIDHRGIVWMGTPGALYAYHSTEKRFIICSESDGVMPNDFLPKPVLVTRQDNVYLGGAMGLVRVNKAFYRGNDRYDNLRMKLLDVQLNGNYISPNYDEEVPSLEIASGFTSIEIHTKLGGSDLFRKRIYRYWIEGLNEDYIESSKSHLKLQRLPPGNYRLRVQCTMSNGMWSPSFALLNVTILPPWWLRSWFILLAALLVLAGVAYFMRRREVQLQRKLEEKEKQLYKDKVQALINMNHELLTPLTLIYSPLKQLLNSRQMPYELRHKLQGTLKQAKQMKNIISMILNMRRMEVGQNLLCLTPTALNEWLQHIITDFESEFEQRNIRLLFRPDEQVGTVSFDQSQCEVILNNLLMNSYKFSSPDTEVVLSTHLDAEGHFVRIELCDQGIGLGNEDPQKLFVRFQRGRHDVGGNGIGLSYAKQLVEMHGGEINAYNNAEQGCTFYFTLPIRQDITQVTCPTKPYLNEFLPEKLVLQEREEAPTAKFHSILIVESDPDLLDFMAANLQAIFEKTYTAHDGMEALPIITSRLPQLIICDLALPRLNGLELCAKVKQNPELSFIPIILLAPDTDALNAEYGYKTGADACVAKPFDMDLLMTQVHNILHNRNIIRKHYQTAELPDMKIESHLEEQFVIQLNKVLAENLSNVTLDVNQVAKLMCMSRASLYNKMKRTIGIGVNEYLTKQRIQYAEQQLLTTHQSIRDISEKAGFLHQRNFSATFKGITGLSPTDYRKEKRGDGAKA